MNPLDPALALPWPAGLEPVLSDKDRDAPTLAEAAAADLLPHWETCQSHYAELRAAYPGCAPAPGRPPPRPAPAWTTSPAVISEAEV